MLFSEQEFQAVMVSLFRAATDYAISEARARTMGDTQAARLAGAFASQAKILGERLSHSGRFLIDANDREIVLAALRHCTRTQFERAEQETSLWEKKKRQAFAAAFASLADRIEAATKVKSN
jgi:hypothetical protein